MKFKHSKSTSKWLLDEALKNGKQWLACKKQKETP